MIICGPAQEEPGRWRVTRHAEVVAALADARLVIPSPPSEADGPMARLRRSVSRFSDGSVHRARRAAAMRTLGAVDPLGLRAEARTRMAAALADQFGGGGRDKAACRPVADAGGRLDLVPLLRTVPVAVLAVALGVPADRGEAVAGAVARIAAAYHPGAAREVVAAADEAVVRLAGLLGDPAPEDLAALAGLLVQSCDATAGLIGNTLAQLLPRRQPVAPDPAGSARPWPGVPVEAVVLETLRYDPPVRATSRRAEAAVELGGQAIEAGAMVVLDLAAANRDPEVFAEPDRFDPYRSQAPALTFGTGARPCPGDVHALELAAGAVETARHCGLARIAYGPVGNLRVPTLLEVTP